MNRCRICQSVIQEKYNGGLALRCSKCRKIQDQRLAEMIQEGEMLESENEYLRNRFFDTESENLKANYDYSRLKKRYDVLQQRHLTVLKENDLLKQSIEEKKGKLFLISKRKRRTEKETGRNRNNSGIKTSRSEYSDE